MPTEVPPQSAHLALTIDGSVWALGASRILSVGSTSDVAALPFPAPGLGGLTASAQGPVLLLTPATGDPTDAMHQVVVASPLGPLALWVQALRPLDGSDRDLPDFDDYLRPRLEDLGPARAQPVRHDGRPSVRSARETFLHVRSGESEAVLPAAAVLRVGRHGGRRRLGTGTPATWLVALDDELVTTRSLAERAPQPQDLTEETWCVRLSGDRQASGLLAAEVLGFIEASRAQRRVLHDASGTSVWLLRDGAPPIEVLAGQARDEQALETDPVSADTQPDASARGDARTSAPTGTVPRSPGGADALCLHLGSWRLSLPAARVQEVLGRVEQTAFAPTRSRGALAVLDLRRLRDTTDVAMPTATPTAIPADAGAWAVRVQFGARPVILIADFLEASSAEPAWSPAPALPRPLQPLIEAVRLQDKGCELLLAPDQARAARHPRVRTFLRQAFAGWMPQSYGRHSH